MVELKNAVIGRRKKDYVLLNESFDKGVHILKENEENLFSFFLLKDGLLKSGDFILDGHNVSSVPDKSDNLILFMIRSSSIVFGATLFVKGEDRKDKMLSLSARLAPLKGKNPVSEEEHAEKIRAVLDILIKEQILYLVLDENEKANQDHHDSIFLTNKELLDQFVTLVYPLKAIEKAEEAEKEPAAEISAPAPENKVVETQPAEKPEEEKKTIKEKPVKVAHQAKAKPEPEDLTPKDFNDGFVEFSGVFAQETKKKRFLRYLRVNYKVFLFLLIPILGYVAFYLLMPYYFAYANNTVGGFLIFGSVICTILYMVFEYNLFDFYKHKNDLHTKEKTAYTLLCHVITLFIGMGLGVGLFFLIANLDKKFVLANYMMNMAYPGIIMSVILAFVPLSAKPVRFILTPIARLFKKK